MSTGSSLLVFAVYHSKHLLELTGEVVLIFMYCLSKTEKSGAGFCLASAPHLSGRGLQSVF